MDRRLLFVETLNDLHEKLQGVPSAYTVMRVAALLRQLLLDGESLLSQAQAQVKHKSKVRVIFQIALGGEYERQILALHPLFWAVADGLDPDTSGVSKPIRQVQLPELLSSRIMIIGIHEYSVKDVIRQLAHVEGGIHAGSPENEKERILTESAQQIAVGGYAPAAAAVRAVGRVVCKGLKPLKDQLEEDLRSEAMQSTSSLGGDANRHPNIEQNQSAGLVRSQPKRRTRHRRRSNKPRK